MNQTNCTYGIVLTEVFGCLKKNIYNQTNYNISTNFTNNTNFNNNTDDEDDENNSLPIYALIMVIFLSMFLLIGVFATINIIYEECKLNSCPCNSNNSNDYQTNNNNIIFKNKFDSVKDIIINVIKSVFQDNQEITMCSICLEDIELGEEISQIKECGHFYHTKCLDTWIVKTSSNATCPLCREKIFYDI